MNESIQKLIDNNKWRPIECAPEHESILTNCKHGLIEGQYDRKSSTASQYYWRDMEWYCSEFRPLPDDRLANALQVAVEALEIAYSKLYILHHTEWAVDDGCKRDCEKGFTAVSTALQKIQAIAEG